MFILKISVLLIPLLVSNILAVLEENPQAVADLTEQTNKIVEDVYESGDLDPENMNLAINMASQQIEAKILKKFFTDTGFDFTELKTVPADASEDVKEEINNENNTTIRAHFQGIDTLLAYGIWSVSDSENILPSSSILVTITGSADLDTVQDMYQTYKVAQPKKTQTTRGAKATTAVDEKSFRMPISFWAMQQVLLLRDPKEETRIQEGLSSKIFIIDILKSESVVRIYKMVDGIVKNVPNEVWNELLKPANPNETPTAYGVTVRDKWLIVCADTRGKKKKDEYTGCNKVSFLPVTTGSKLVKKPVANNTTTEHVGGVPPVTKGEASTVAKQSLSSGTPASTVVAAQDPVPAPVKEGSTNTTPNDTSVQTKQKGENYNNVNSSDPAVPPPPPNVGTNTHQDDDPEPQQEKDKNVEEDEVEEGEEEEDQPEDNPAMNNTAQHKNGVQVIDSNTSITSVDGGVNNSAPLPTLASIASQAGIADNLKRKAQEARKRTQGGQTDNGDSGTAGENTGIPEKKTEAIITDNTPSEVKPPADVVKDNNSSKKTLKDYQIETTSPRVIDHADTFNGIIKNQAPVTPPRERREKPTTTSQDQTAFHTALTNIKGQGTHTSAKPSFNLRKIAGLPSATDIEQKLSAAARTSFNEFCKTKNGLGNLRVIVTKSDIADVRAYNYENANKVDETKLVNEADIIAHAFWTLKNTNCKAEEMKSFVGNKLAEEKFLAQFLKSTTRTQIQLSVRLWKNAGYVIAVVALADKKTQ